MDSSATEQPRTGSTVDVGATASGSSMATTGEGSRGTSTPSRQTVGPSGYGNLAVKHTTAATHVQGSTTASEGEASTSRLASVCGSVFTARLWKWAQNASWNAGPKGGRRLKDITLEHVLSGETCAPISLSDFESFLAHCDYSLENLQFVVWYLDYQKRFDALSDEQRKLSPPPCRAKPARFSTIPTSSTPSDPIRKKRKLCINTSAIAAPSSSPSLPSPPPPPSNKLPLPVLSPVASNASGGAPPTPTSPAPAYSVSDPRFTSATTFGTSSTIGPDLDLKSFYAYAYDSSSFPLTRLASNSGTVPELELIPSAQTPTTAHPLLDSTQAHLLPSPPSPLLPLPSTHLDSEAQPFRTEVQRVLATFVLPGSRKELLLDADERDLALSESALTTHPDVFAPLHATCLTHLRLVALPRFLLNGATNVNRPKQIFWYLCGLFDIAIGITLALLVVLCPIDRWMVTPGRTSTHRAWRLIGLPLFWLGTMQWYAAYRGFCSQIFFRGTTQLRTWELDTFEGEVRPSDEVEVAREENGTVTDQVDGRKKGMRPSAVVNGTDRIAPFLDIESRSLSSASSIHPNNSANHIKAPRTSMSKDRAALSGGAKNNAYFSHTENSTQKSRPTTSRSRRRRPPVFGPERIVEDETIRAVHAQVWRDLLKFGAAWAVIFVAVAVSVPSLRVASYPPG